ncbi:jerky homolog-like [Brachionus plicatilis]|uniref:Jerky homolog-like n=1 Tax=Brachionus plicatilis TaxID=10195 RepID=A0A3M7Q2Y4_BRAPC|nr:jerky homolog-like [Brachionus plicatilis]
MYRVRRIKKNGKPVLETASNSKKRNRLDFLQKEEIIKKIRLGFGHVKVAGDFNIGISTVYKIWKNENNLAMYSEENPNSPLLKSLKGSDFPLVDQALKTWFFQERANNNFLSMPILSEKALQFYNMFKEQQCGQKPFQGSIGLAQKFCTRYGIKSNKAHGESLSADNIAAEDFVKNFQNLISGYSTHQIYNADECGLNYYCLPTSS